MDIKDIANQVRTELKSRFPEYKFSVTIERYTGGQTMKIALMSGPDDPFDGTLTYPTRDGETYPQGDYAQLNHHYITKDSDGRWRSNGHRLTRRCALMMKRVTKIANRQNWDNSDSMIDYFDVNFYLDLDIGKWNKPYKIV